MINKLFKVMVFILKWEILIIDKSNILIIVLTIGNIKL